MIGEPPAGLVPFLQVAEQASFRKAADVLGVSSQAVSQAVAKLEAELGVKLLARTSRTVSLTPEGEIFRARAKSALAQLEDAKKWVSQARQLPSGPLAVSVPFILGRFLVPRLAPFVVRYPEITLRLSFTDRQARLVDERIDVALRLGDLDDSSLISRRLAVTRWVTLAAPEYLEKNGFPRTMDDLDKHNCLRFMSPRGRLQSWVLGGKIRSVEGRLVVDQGEMLLEAALAGVGICQVLDFMVGEAVASGKLVEVLPELACAGPALHALSLPEPPSRVRAFVATVAEFWR